MLANKDMIANRYGQWARSRRIIKAIQDCLRNDGVVIISTYTKATQYDKRHVDMFKCDQNGAYVRHGRRWDCIDYAGITCYSRKGD